VGKPKGKKKKKKFKKGVKNWKEKYEKFYKNKKKFILDIIREEEGPFLFKIQLQYNRFVNNINQSKKKSKFAEKENLSAMTPEEESKNLFAVDENNNTINADKLKAKFLKFFKISQIRVEEQDKVIEKPQKKKKKKIEKPCILLHYDKIKLGSPKNDQIKAFVTVFGQEDGVKVYDYFFKLKSKKFSSAIYLIISDKILKKHTMRQIKLHETKKQKQTEEVKVEQEKRLDLSSSIIIEDDHENSGSVSPKERTKKPECDKQEVE
jgi:hypothetical protein